MSMKVLVLCCLLVNFHCLYGQEVKGSIYDLRTQLPIEGALIEVEDSFHEVLSSLDGNFVILDVASNNHVLKITKEGYIIKFLPFSKKYLQTVNFKTIYLEVDVKELQQENSISLSDSDFIDDVDTDFSGQMLQATRDIFLSRAAFDFSQSFFKVKGYDSKYGDVLINGVRMNRVFNGRPQWSNWGGINDVLRNQEYFYGLKANPYGFGGLLGTTNMNTNPAKMRPGIRLSSSASNKSYRGRLMATYNSGVKKSGISYSLSASKRWGKEGYVSGTLYDAYSVFGAIGYQTGKHNFYFTGMYTPNRRGKSAAITAEVFQLIGRRYNPYWGEQNGEIRNSRERNIEEPIAMFNYDFSGDKLTVNFGAAYQFGSFSSSRLGYYNAPSPNPDYYRYLPSFYINNSLGANFDNANLAKEGFQENPQMQWSSLYSANLSSERNGKSSYVLYNDQADENQLFVNINSSYIFSDYFKIDGGFRYHKSDAENYGLLLDLLGGDFHEDIDTFSDTKNDVEHEVQKGVGDKMGYNYNINSSFYEGFLQGDFQLEKFAFFVSAKISQTTYQREGLFLNERFPLTSQGKGEIQNFTDYGFKTGLTYKFNNRHIVNLSAAYLTKAPTLQNTFVNARENNKTVDSLQSEVIYSGVLTYNLDLPNISMRLTGYYSKFKEVTDINYFYVDAGVGSDFIQEVVTGIEKLHYGGELGFSYQATTEIKLTAVASYGDFSYTENANVTINFDTVGAEEDLINLIGTLDLGETAIKDFKLAVGPQKAYSIGVDYRSSNYWWVGTTGNYLADNYVDISAIKRTNSFLQDPDGDVFPNATSEIVTELLTQERLTPVYLLNLTGGKSWLIDKKYISFFVSVNNLFDVSYRTGGYEQSRNGNFGQAYNDTQRGAPLFGNKYWYGYGRSYFVNLALSF
ncbi:P44/Msp2 family outer membrane protein [Joostella sp.]|uniref:P44/Msp2 family outer membrane protein n=1 Tax=Joostella sp. TaxID=2231138 RepID=UPI003A95D3F6